MDDTYESEVKEKMAKGDPLPNKIDIPIVKYFWQSNPLTPSRTETIPKFLRKIPVLKNFTDNELRILSKSMHHRHFTGGEKIFKQNESGIGFYFIYDGQVDIIIENNIVDNEKRKLSSEAKILLSLDKYDYFGELALLQEGSIRNASVVAKYACELIGIFRPDVEILINEEPIVATKLLQSISMIVATRLHSVTSEVQRLKAKVKFYEEKYDVKKHE